MTHDVCSFLTNFLVFTVHHSSSVTYFPLTLSFFYSTVYKSFCKFFKEILENRFVVMANHGRGWSHSGRITKSVDRQRCRVSFREHTTSYHTHPHPPHPHTPHSYVHSGSSVSTSLPQRGLRLLRRNRCLET